jgi:site-specific recombinase XerD
MDVLRSWFDEWLLDLRTRELSPHSLRAYSQGIHSLLRYLADQDPTPTQPEQISRRHLEGWTRAMAEAGLAASTRQLRIIAVQMWLGYIMRSDDSDLTVNHAEDLPEPTVIVKPVPVVPDEATHKLLLTCQGAGFAPRRDNLIIRLLNDTGSRASEVAGIDLDDVDERHQQILVHGKGRKDRMVVYSGRTALALLKYKRARERHQAAAGHPALLLAVRRNPHVIGAQEAWRISGATVRSMLERRCADAGVAPINPHRFRNTWASDMLRQGMNEMDVERLAGWSSPAMVRRYALATADERAREAALRIARGDRF